MASVASAHDPTNMASTFGSQKVPASLGKICHLVLYWKLFSKNDVPPQDRRIAHDSQLNWYSLSQERQLRRHQRRLQLHTSAVHGNSVNVFAAERLDTTALLSLAI